MRIKRSVKPTKLTEEQKYSVTSECAEFLRSVSLAEKVSEHTRILQERYSALFNESLPVGVPLSFLRTKIAYRILRDSYVSAGIKIPDKVQRRYEMSQSLKHIAKLANVLPSLKLEEGGPVSSKTAIARAKKPKAKRPEKEKKLTVTDIWYKLMQEAPALKKTDAELAKEMQKRSPTKTSYSEASVVSVRRLYNQGKLSCQNGKRPTIQLVRYEK